jgi:hypothetical protein
VRSAIVSSKLKVVLLVVLLFGAPALVTAALLTSDFSGAAADGSQPGGHLRGVVVDESGRAIGGLDVELAGASTSGQRSDGPTATTAADGTFELSAPPLDGHYEIRSGGGDWQRVVQAYSFIDPSGKLVEPHPVRLTVLPGCRLELEFARNDGRPAGDGEFTLQGKFGSGLFFGLVKPELKKAGPVRDGRLELAGLPPMKADIFVRMSSGETVELTLALTPGRNRKRIQI